MTNNYTDNGFAQDTLSASIEAINSLSLPSVVSNISKPSSSALTLGQLQTEFIKRKTKDNVSPRTFKQLSTRTEYMVDLLGKNYEISKIKHQQANRLIKSLTEQGLKEKTIHEYKAACIQMFLYAVKKKYIDRNPFEKIPVQKETTPRLNWQSDDLVKLFSSVRFTEPDANQAQENYWLPLLLLYTGAKPSEICQLKSTDIIMEQGVLCFVFFNENTALKDRKNMECRYVPVHSKLISLGFMNYVKQRKKKLMAQLFDYKPIGKYKEWSRNFERQFNICLTQLGFAKGHRPTASGFRYTVTTMLQQKNVSECIASDLIGFTYKGNAYMRDRISSSISERKAAIEKLDFSFELSKVTPMY